ncbi:MADS-box transcription factor family protein [Striga hermonthica]|uniref:MADS-box transcription factor family protein n=1 Tax=Striga hermonthica TaxID=68872 RepID=A0A9N7RSD3_STRHE|nr:MADS-box transcription factor family protein [Striga hermonthica]
MARKRAKHGPIENERARDSTLKRRLESLYKKAQELSILCNLEMFIVILNPNDDTRPIMWPSHENATTGITKFLAFSEQERAKKMVLQEKLLTEKMHEMTEKLSKLRKKNDETEIGILTKRVLDGGQMLNELHWDQLNRMNRFVGDKMNRLQKRRDELDEETNIFVH